MTTPAQAVVPFSRTNGTGPFVIAEIGVNHGGDLALARRLVEGAAAAGADCVKFQTYKAGSLAVRDAPAYWDRGLEPAATQCELFRRYDRFEADDYAALAEHAARCGVAFASTPFDLAAVDMLAPLVPFYKIASADITNEPLLIACARHGKPLLISTGASHLTEIEAAVRVARDFLPASRIGILHCVLSYPTAVPDANLRAIEHLARAFPGHPIGYSDHTRPDPAMLVLIRAALLGAAVVEKHFTHDKSLPGNDHYHAMDADDLRRFRSGLALIRDADGVASKTVLPAEEASRLHARRSLVAVRPLPAGHVLAADDLTAKRPATGLPPSELQQVVGRRLARDLAADEPLMSDDLATT
jgi:N-acetylneuraminate synthase